MNYLKIKKIYVMIALFLILCDSVLILAIGGFYKPSVNLEVALDTEIDQNVQISYGVNKGNTSDNLNFYDFFNNKNKSISLKIPLDVQTVRFDFSAIKDDVVSVKNVNICVFQKCQSLNNEFTDANLVNQLEPIDTGYRIDGDDPYLYYEIESNIIGTFFEKMITMRLAIALAIAIGFDVFFMILLFFLKKNTEVKSLINNRKTIWNLAKRDFKTRYAGSYLGIFWAFVQPIVTILIYWFVFEVGFKSAPANGFPFVLWLIAGIVPWFMFSDGLTAVTNCLLEYAFLVKKVVFDIKMLPFVKVISALFVQVFFIFFSMFIFLINGYYPSLYLVQILYYLFATIMLVIGLGFITSAVIVFFRDLGQIVQIFLQIGVWLTPIMWNLSMLSPKLQMIFKFNPCYYIVEGYRDAFINHIWFWEKPFATLYFWLIIIIILFVGKTVFNRLKAHFADVL